MITQTATPCSPPASMRPRLTIDLRGVGVSDVATVGGKSASLAEMIRERIVAESLSTALRMRTEVAYAFAALASHLFDERNPGVKKLIETVIDKARAKGRKMGICGETPSSYPDVAELLATVGMDSESLNHDSLPGVGQRLAGAACA